MHTDLLIQLLDNMIDHGKPPDILSREFEEGKAVIRFEWFNGHIKEFGYTPARYDAAWRRFQSHWNGPG
mgnify:CR=1 FL=1